LLWAKRAFLLLIREELGATVGDFVVAERVLFWAVPGAVQGVVARAEKVVGALFVA